MLVAYLLRNCGTDLAKLFLLAPSWSGGGFAQNKFWIRDPAFSDFRKNRIPDPKFFWLKTTPDPDRANKKTLSPISPAVPEEKGHKHRSCCYIIEILWYKVVSQLIEELRVYSINLFTFLDVPQGLALLISFC